MSLHYELPIYKSCYDLLLEIFLFTNNFSKDFKYLSIGLASKDKIHLENFLNDLNSNYKISSFKIISNSLSSIFNLLISILSKNFRTFGNSSILFFISSIEFVVSVFFDLYSIFSIFKISFLSILI